MYTKSILIYQEEYMFKKTLLLTIITIISFAQESKEIQHPESLNVKTLIKEFIDEIEKNQNTCKGGWLIKDRKKNDISESFFITFAAPNIDTDLSKENNLTIDNINGKADDVVGLSVFNDINYTKDHMKAVSTLVKFPKKINLNKDKNLLFKKIINDKVLVINSEYNMINHNYLVSYKDINISIPNELKLETNNIKFNGNFDPNKLIEHNSAFTIDSIKIMPLVPNLLGTYINMKNFKIATDMEIKSERVSINYTISMDLFDSIFDKEQIKIEKMNISLSMGNLHLSAYEELVKFLQNNTENMESLENNSELQILMLELFARSKDIYIEISDLSVLNIAFNGENIGPTKINAKVSLKGTKELIQMIAVNPAFALNAITVEAKLELPKEILKKLYKEDKAFGSLAFLFAKYQNENLIYDATFKEGKLIINDQLFTNSLQNLNTPKYMQRLESTIYNNHEEKKEIDNNIKYHTAKVNSKHVEKYEQNALHQAILSADTDEVKKVLENALDINHVDKLGRTPLHYAAFNGDIESAKLLLDKGVNINAMDSSKHWTALFFAVYMKHQKMVEFLIAKGADQTLKDKFNRSINAYR